MTGEKVVDLTDIIGSFNMQLAFMYLWIFPFIVLVYTTTKDRVGFLSLSFVGLFTWSVCLAGYLENVK